MPGSVQNAAPGAVLPLSLSTAFVHTREYSIIGNDYRNGESQRSRQASTSRKRWTLSKRLTPAQLQSLRDFYEARSGSHEPFYFYDTYDASPRFSYDSTGQSLNGRYVVRFDCEWSQSVGPGRSDVQIQLIELA
jgi:hypothetical protein